MQKFSSKILIIILSVVLPMQLVEARAFCALRDPVTSIKHLFPESNNHQSIVRAINSEMRDKISNYLPFTLHFNELGKHTLYVAQSGEGDLGFVHVRSELTEWGLIEIAWALSHDLTIRSAKFQRCRIPNCEDKYLLEILDATAGKSYSELHALIREDGQDLKAEVKAKYKDASALVLSAVRSALKTISVTAIAWNKEVSENIRNRLLKKNLDEKNNLTLIPFKIPAKRLESIDVMMGGGGSMLDRKSIQAFHIKHNNKALGIVVSANWSDGDFHGILHWLFDSKGKVLDIYPVPAWPNNEVSQAFLELQGETLIDAENCNTAAQLVAFELYYLSR